MEMFSAYCVIVMVYRECQCHVKIQQINLYSIHDENKRLTPDNTKPLRLSLTSTPGQ